MEREDICMTHIKLIESAFIMWGLMALIHIMSSAQHVLSLLVLLFFAIACPFILKKYKILIKIFRLQKVKETLPQEIMTRTLDRMSLFYLTIFTSTLYLTILSLPGENGLIIVVSCFAHVIMLFLLLVFEYLLCTTTLPPGEKEKRKFERETRHLTLQRIKG